jgi:hypothetical protein
MYSAKKPVKVMEEEKQVPLMQLKEQNLQKLPTAAKYDFPFKLVEHAQTEINSVQSQAPSKPNQKP